LPEKLENGVAHAPSWREHLIWIAPILLILTFGIMSLLESRILPPADFGDEPAFFNEACWISEQGGPLAFFKHAVTGAYPYDNRHPLVQLCASPVAERTPDAVRPMRATKVGLSMLSLILVFIIAWRVVSIQAATTTIALLAISHNWFTKARILCAEPVIYVAFFLAWAFAAGVVRVRGRWWWAGAMTGIAYLAKGSTVLILISLVIASLCWIILLTWRHGGRGFRYSYGRTWRAGILFFMGFVLLAGPLLVRNVVRFGNPFHNYNSRLMWADSWDDHMATDDQRAKHPQTPLAYLSRTPIKTIARRIVWGLGKQIPRLLGSLAPSRETPRLIRIPLLLLSSALLLLGLWASVRRIRSWDGTFTLVLAGMGLLLFAWYSSITYSSRFAATLAPVVLLQAVRWRGKGGWFSGRWLAWICVGGAVIIMLTQMTPGLIRKQSAPLPMSPEYRALMAWHRKYILDKPAVSFQTPYLAPRYTFQWMLTGDRHIHEIPALHDFGTLSTLMDKKDARYLIIERDSFIQRQALLGDYFEIASDNSIKLRVLPNGWQLHTRDDHGTVDYLILERTP
jgi:hypothetical protein